MREVFCYLVAISLILITLACGKYKKVLVYKDSSTIVETRVRDLLERMTLEEKIAQLSEASCDGLKEDK